MVDKTVRFVRADFCCLTFCNASVRLLAPGIRAIAINTVKLHNNITYTNILLVKIISIGEFFPYSYQYSIPSFYRAFYVWYEFT